MTSEHAETTPGALRSLNLNIVHASLTAVGSLLVVIDTEVWWQVAVLALGVVAGLMAVSQGGARRFSHVVLPCLVVTAAVWVFGVLAADNPSASYGLAIAGTVTVHRFPHRRRAVLAGLVVFAAAVLAAGLVVWGWDVAEVLIRVVVSGSVALTAVVLASLHHVVSGLTDELEKSRQREAELAVARERIRFASDLHDIQGHTLHVVKLKIALAEKLLRSDVGRVEEELREVRDLVGDTITQTKELAYAQRRLNLSAELENAKNLFSAAGISVHVVRESEVTDTRAGELLGQILRETTTNILRHAEAGQVRITLSESGIAIVNDGAGTDALPRLRGLSTLRERVAGEGGELTIEQQNGRFLTAATFPRLRSGATL
ncbi:sensor histidine kinase [Nocardiopsis sediminis]|uniref:Sensor histidine kinase n=1 Tax=Nocardiopsis sediminis TaxID=1778267 RepID=A0ABV8FRT7_9ACTN